MNFQAFMVRNDDNLVVFQCDFFYYTYFPGERESLNDENIVTKSMEGYPSHVSLILGDLPILTASSIYKLLLFCLSE